MCIRVSDVVARVDYHEKMPEEVVSSFPALTYYHERPNQIRTEMRDHKEHLTRTAKRDR